MRTNPVASRSYPLRSRAAALSPLACLVLALPAFAQEQQPTGEENDSFEWEYSVNASVDFQRATGNEETSTIPQSEAAQVNHSAGVRWKLPEEGVLSIQTDFRNTEDPLADAERFTVTSFELRYENPYLQVVVGDFGVSFSTYSLSQAGKGIYATYEREPLGAFHISLGTNKPTWKTLLEKVEDEPPDQYFQGVRYERTFFDDRLLWGTSVTHARDDLSTVSDGQDLIGMDHWMVETDLDYQITEGLHVASEVAWSRFDEDTDQPGEVNRDVAALLEFSCDLGAVSGAVTAERVGREFGSSSGSSTSGLSRLNASASWSPADVFSLDAHTSLERRVGEEETDRSLSSSLGWSLENLDLFPDWRLRNTLEFSRHLSGGGDWSRTRSLSASMSNTLFGLSGGLDYRYQLQDSSQSDRGSRIHSFSLSAGAPLSFISEGAALSTGLTYTRSKSFSADDPDKNLSANLNASVPILEPLSTYFSYSRTISRPGEGANSTSESINFGFQFDFPGEINASVALDYAINNHTSDEPAGEFGERIFSFTFSLGLP